MQREQAGRYILDSSSGETVAAFVPAPLPPDPPLQIDDALRLELDGALLNLGRLDSAATWLPDVSLFLYQYIRKEAVLSSRIEGTQSSLSDLMLFEADALPGVPLDDVREVSGYVRALEHGIRRMRAGFPLCLRLLREVHGILVEGGRGADKQPGEFRTTQNWIGGTRPGNAVFVPPPPQELAGCLKELELFIQGERGPGSGLLKAALAHVQFESIHPFLDGNGRVGRMLITLMLVNEGLLHEPLLYLSLFFKNHRQTYYDLLQRVRTEGDWEAWVAFFAEAVRITAVQGSSSAARINRTAAEHRRLLQGMGRISGSALRVHQALLATPVSTIAALSRSSGLVPNTIHKVLTALGEAGLIEETSGRQRNRVFVYRSVLDILAEEME